MEQFNTIIARSQGRDLIGAIEQGNYTRGLSHRGRVVLTRGQAVIVVECANMTYSAVAEFATVAEAEAFARGERRGDAMFRAYVQADEERRRLDSGY